MIRGKDAGNRMGECEANASDVVKIMNAALMTILKVKAHISKLAYT